jgi:hypothetical protein
MPFISTQLADMYLGFPDVCLTPPLAIPIPYPNIGLSTMGIGFVPNVLINAMPVHNLLTTIALTNGDQAGAMMGVASGLIMGPVHNLIGSFKVIAGIAPVMKFLGMTIQNNTNAPGFMLLPTQFQVMALA